MWHPYWALFCIIPAYYIVVEPIKAAVAKKKTPILTVNINGSDSDDDENDENED